ncbi:hypothetical protein Ais01nite_73640 [Asanoa ishikariensis]|nr:hypothetical protein [Asanoa ishikariensis]GIF69329.1 hypothetical protein Ais01nite_73640 [Asanoa ishikariensis]
MRPDGHRANRGQVLDKNLTHHPITAIARTRYGVRIPVTTADLIQRYLYMFGTWEPNPTAWICRQLRPGDPFIDVGAHIRHFSLLAATLVGPSGCVVAIEASPRFAATLAQTATANGYTNVRVVASAVSATARELNLYIKTRTTSAAGPACAPRRDRYPLSAHRQHLCPLCSATRS